MERLLDHPVTLTLLLINLAVSGYALSVDPTLVGRLAFRPGRIRAGKELYRFLTAGFVHANGAHLAVNMITFFFFGPHLEEILGPVRFLVLYLGSELLAHAATFAVHRNSPDYSAVGASGAIAGVVFAFCVFEPLRLLYLFFAIPIPALLFAVGYVAASVYAVRSGAGRSVGVAHEAHLGGAVAGVVLTVLLEPRAIGAFLEALQKGWGT